MIVLFSLSAAFAVKVQSWYCAPVVPSANQLCHDIIFLQLKDGFLYILVDTTACFTQYLVCRLQGLNVIQSMLAVVQPVVCVDVACDS